LLLLIRFLHGPERKLYIDVVHLSRKVHAGCFKELIEVETADTITILDIGLRGGIYDQGRPQCP
jgi:hypothetical protein